MVDAKVKLNNRIQINSESNYFEREINENQQFLRSNKQLNFISDAHQTQQSKQLDELDAYQRKANEIHRHKDIMNYQLSQIDSKKLIQPQHEHIQAIYKDSIDSLVQNQKQDELQQLKMKKQANEDNMN